MSFKGFQKSVIRVSRPSDGGASPWSDKKIGAANVQGEVQLGGDH
jgi:hypothetical protein